MPCSGPRRGVERARLAQREFAVDRFPRTQFPVARLDRGQGGFDGFDHGRFH
jgi:hypothetical protein